MSLSVRYFVFLLFSLIVSCNQQKTSNSKENNKIENTTIKTGNTEIHVPSISIDELNALGLINVKSPSEWESLSIQHKPLYQVLTLNGKKDIYVNFHAALVLHRNKKNILPTISESYRFMEQLNSNLNTFLAYVNENTSFVQYKGKVFDLKVANYWLLQDTMQPACSLHVLTISPNEKRAYITKSSCQSAYPLRNVKIEI